MQNRARAMALLTSRLAERLRQEHQAQLDEIRGEQGEAAWDGRSAPTCCSLTKW